MSLKTSLVQLVERRFPKPNAVGSSPTGRVSEHFVYKIMCNLKAKKFRQNSIFLM